MTLLSECVQANTCIFLGLEDWFIEINTIEGYDAQNSTVIYSNLSLNEMSSIPPEKINQIKQIIHERYSEVGESFWTF